MLQKEETFWLRELEKNKLIGQIGKGQWINAGGTRVMLEGKGIIYRKGEAELGELACRWTGVSFIILGRIKRVRLKDTANKTASYSFSVVFSGITGIFTGECHLTLV